MEIKPEMVELSDELEELMGIEGFIDNSRYHELVRLLAFEIKSRIKAVRWLESLEKYHAV
jgi:hypothetical protein